MSNLYKQLLGILPSEPIDKGQVIAINSDGVTVQLVSGAQVRVKGTAEISAHVFIKSGRVEGPAPDLPGVVQYV
jgi:hypothetical protein